MHIGCGGSNHRRNLNMNIDRRRIYWRRRATVLLVPLTAGALLVAACSDDTEAQPATSAAPATAPPAPTTDPAVTGGSGLERDPDPILGAAGVSAWLREGAPEGMADDVLALTDPEFAMVCETMAIEERQRDAAVAGAIYYEEERGVDRTSRNRPYWQDVAAWRSVACEAQS